jgi:UDP-N-acetylglucosamine 2-epimerase (non-hydrolysing)
MHRKLSSGTSASQLRWRAVAISMKTILVFAGTRPEIIKMAPIVRELRARQGSQTKKQDAWQAHFCFTGQHDQLGTPFLEYFDIEPDSRLEIMESGQSLGQLASAAIAQIDALIEKHPNSCAALVQGDTTTALTAALSAFYHKIAVGHVEAGLRTSNINEPFPEELNRRLITRIAKWHYAPTEVARTALLREGVVSESILVTQNTGIDSFLWTIVQPHQPISADLAGLDRKRLVLVTVHRRENIGAPLDRIASALTELSREFKDVVFLLPVHKNPEVSKTIRGRLSGIRNLRLTEQLAYLDLVWTMKNAELILTDSGGIQEEAPSLNKPVLVLRDETERPEAIDYGTSFVVGSDTARVVRVATEFLTGKRKLRLRGTTNPYGDGRAARKIVDHLLSQISVWKSSGAS